MEAIRMHADMTSVESDRLSKARSYDVYQSWLEAVNTCSQYVTRLELYHEGLEYAAF